MIVDPKRDSFYFKHQGNNTVYYWDATYGTVFWDKFNTNNPLYTVAEAKANIEKGVWEVLGV
tara:strand:- start:3192 stop:3377 length:186 start_codon:yes stop_codon:yes gene_type:complete